MRSHIIYLTLFNIEGCNNTLKSNSDEPILKSTDTDYR